MTIVELLEKNVREGHFTQGESAIALGLFAIAEAIKELELDTEVDFNDLFKSLTPPQQSIIVETDNGKIEFPIEQK